MRHLSTCLGGEDVTAVISTKLMSAPKFVRNYVRLTTSGMCDIVGRV